MVNRKDFRPEKETNYWSQEKGGVTYGNPEKERKAMRHPDKLHAGAKKRKKLTGKQKFHVVMKEWKRGTLYSGSGRKVRSQKQAVAIAYSEERKAKKGHHTQHKRAYKKRDNRDNFSWI